MDLFELFDTCDADELEVWYMARQQNLGRLQYLQNLAYIVELNNQWSNIISQWTWHGVRGPETRASFRLNTNIGWSLETEHDENVRRYCRLTLRQVDRVAAALWPDQVARGERLRYGTCTCTPREAVYIVCQRLAHPDRWYGQSGLWGSHPTTLIRLFRGILHDIHDRYSELITWWPGLNSYDRLKAYGLRVAAVGFGNGRFWGFVDGVFQGFCAPENNQHQVLTYSKYYKANGLKYQAITTPDGLCPHMSMPNVGPASDWTIYRQSCVPPQLRRIFEGRELLFVIGDNAYHNLYGAIAPQADARGYRWLTVDQRHYNADLSSVRMSVEMFFGKMENFWSFNQFKNILQPQNMPVGLMWRVSVFLHNILVCVRQEDAQPGPDGVVPVMDLVGRRFHCMPPTLEGYLNPVQ